MMINSEFHRLSTEVLVVGAGPAGLAAAELLSKHGAKVVVVDENPELGGQYFRQRADWIREQDGDFRPEGRRLVESVHNGENITVLTSAFVFATDDSLGSCYAYDERAGKVLVIDAERIVIATGSHELVIPYHGWDVPKCITPGMASRLFDVDSINPAQSIVVGGSGPFLLSVAAHLIKRGVDVKAVIDYHRPYRLRLSSIFIGIYPSRLWEFISYRLVLLRGRVPVLQGYQIESVLPNAGSLRSTFRSRSTTDSRQFDTDYVAVSYGFVPTTELPTLLGVTLEPRGLHLTAGVTICGRTQNERVYVTGESVDIQGWRSALKRGELAAWDILFRQARTRGTGWIRRIRLVLGLWYERGFAAIRRVQFSEDEHFQVPMSDEVIVCRCESVRFAEISRYLDQPWSTASGLKAETRVGMGTCQGRQCGYALSRICASTGVEAQSINPRIPLRPVPVSALTCLPHDDSAEAH